MDVVVEKWCCVAGIVATTSGITKVFDDDDKQETAKISIFAMFLALNRDSFRSVFQYNATIILKWEEWFSLSAIIRVRIVYCN